MQANPYNKEVPNLYLEVVRATVTSGQAVLKTAVLINGAACIAILAFLGQVLEKPLPETTIVIAKDLADALLYFVWGVALSTGAGGTTYLTNLIQGWNPFRFWQAYLWVGLVTTVLLVLASLILFVCGGYQAKSAFTNYFAKKTPAVPPLVPKAESK